MARRKSIDLAIPARHPSPGDPRAWVRRIVVAQWGRTIAEAFQTICSQAFPAAEICACSSGVTTLQALRNRPADVLLLAMSLPDMDGGDVLQRVTSEKLSRRVLVVCHRRDEQCLRTLRDGRFDGLVDTQEETVPSLIRALQLVATDAFYVSPSFREKIVDRTPLGRWLQLTPAELRVFRAIGDGSGNQEAARNLGLTSATVQTHRRNLMKKIGISTSAKLVFEAVRLGVVRFTDDGQVIRPGFESALGPNPPFAAVLE